MAKCEEMEERCKADRCWEEWKMCGGRMKDGGEDDLLYSRAVAIV